MRRRRGAKSIATCRSRRVRRRWRRLGVRRTHDQALQLAGRWASGAARQNRPHLRELGGSGLGRSVRPHTLSRCYARGVAAEAHGEACGHHAQHRDPHRGGSDRARGEVQERLPLPRIRSGRPPCCRLRDRGCRCRLPRRRRPQHLRGAAAGAPRGVRVRHGPPLRHRTVLPRRRVGALRKPRQRRGCGLFRECPVGCQRRFQEGPPSARRCGVPRSLREVVIADRGRLSTRPRRRQLRLRRRRGRPPGRVRGHSGGLPRAHADAAVACRRPRRRGAGGRLQLGEHQQLHGRLHTGPLRRPDASSCLRSWHRRWRGRPCPSRAPLPRGDGRARAGAPGAALAIAARARRGSRRPGLGASCAGSGPPGHDRRNGAGLAGACGVGRELREAQTPAAGGAVPARGGTAGSSTGEVPGGLEHLAPVVRRLDRWPALSAGHVARSDPRAGCAEHRLRAPGSHGHARSPAGVLEGSFRGSEWEGREGPVGGPGRVLRGRPPSVSSRMVGCQFTSIASCAGLQVAHVSLPHGKRRLVAPIGLQARRRHLGVFGRRLGRRAAAAATGVGRTPREVAD
mmetsp:Transcript_135005/g.431336  ORF Transcript_135005/g.431336 Transcript_135005/m.431336 type:complete len:569 (-) Transcript_135005:565-2271(-)